jgi:hypothetical protein
VELLQARDHGIAAHVVVGVPEHLDVGMEGLQGVLGVLRVSVLRVTGLGRPYDRVHCACQSPSAD